VADWRVWHRRPRGLRWRELGGPHPL